MSDDDDRPVRLLSTKPPPGEGGVHEELTRVGRPPEDVLAMVRPERARDSRAPTAPPPALVEGLPGAERAARSIPWPPIVTIPIFFLVVSLVLALLTR